MSTRGLALWALFLALLCAGVAYLTCERLGYIGEIEVPALEFENRMLTVPRAQRVVLRPMRHGVTWARYWFGPRVNDPASDDPVCPFPRIRVGLENQHEDEDTWYFQQAQFFALAQMGAMTTDEWLEELRPVRERLPDGSDRIVVRAVFGHQSGAQVHYFYDIENPVPGLGWYRHELFAEGSGRQVYFAFPAN